MSKKLLQKHAFNTINSLLKQHPIPLGESLSVSGWIRSQRNHKDTCFLAVNDGTSLKDLQIVLDLNAFQGNKDISTQLKRLNVGTAVKISGKWVPSPAKGQAFELQAQELQVLGDCDPESYPLFKSRASFDYLREYQHLRSRSKTFGALWRIRNSAILGISDFFQKNEFIQIHTPVLTSNDCEGGGEAFRVLTDQDIVKEKKESGFFPNPTYLTVSSQLHLEIASASHSRVYALNPAFRAEPSNSTRHLAEFWMLEAEMSFLYSLPELLDLIERCIQSTTRYILEKSEEDVQFCQQFIDKEGKQRLEGLLQPFERISYTEAVDLLIKAKRKWEHPVKWGLGLQSEHERYLAEEVFKKPVFVTRYPSGIKPFYMKTSSTGIKPFYMKTSHDGQTVECTDLLVPKIGELVGGSLRQDNTALLEKQIQKAGLNPELYNWYVDLRRYGSVPHGGFGLGLERYLAYITGMWNIKDWSLAPRYKGHCQF